jgi:hypothetical protein
MKLYDGRRPLSTYEAVFLLAQEHDFRLPRSVLRAASKAVGFTSDRIEDALSKLGASIAGGGDDLAYVIPRDQRGVAAVKLSDAPGSAVVAPAQGTRDDDLGWMPAAEARRALGGPTFARLWREGKLTHKREGSRRWVVRKADVLDALSAKPAARSTADQTIAAAIARTTSKTSPRHASDPKSGPLKFSDDEHSPAREHGNKGDLSAYRERRRYRRNAR